FGHEYRYVAVHAALLVVAAAAAFVERERGVDQVAMILHQETHAVEVVWRLLAAGERELDTALRPETLALEANHRVGEYRRHGLVVRGTARVEEAVFLDQLEGIAHPVGAIGFDHVDVREQQ